jgi:hypothetical protein
MDLEELKCPKCGYKVGTPLGKGGETFEITEKRNCCFCIRCLAVLWVDGETSSARFDFPPVGGAHGKMTLGFRKPFNTFTFLTEVLLHESFEVCALVLDYRYERDQNHSSQDCLFVFRHEDFNRICQHQSEFVAAALPALWRWYKKQKGKLC